MKTRQFYVILNAFPGGILENFARHKSRMMINSKFDFFRRKNSQKAPMIPKDLSLPVFSRSLAPIKSGAKFAEMDGRKRIHLSPVVNLDSPMSDFLHETMLPVNENGDGHME